MTPAHIVPEWYFLPFYAILRAVPNKLGGVILLLSAIVVLVVLPFISFSQIRSSTFREIYKILFWFFFIDCLILGWVGGKSIETPFYEISQGATIFYFAYLIILIPLITQMEIYVWSQLKK